MSEQTSVKPRRCEVCGGKPSWTCPAANVVLCGNCLIQPGIAGGIDHLIPGSPRKCAHWLDSNTGEPHILSYMDHRSDVPAIGS